MEFSIRDLISIELPKENLAIKINEFDDKFSNLSISSDAYPIISDENRKLLIKNINNFSEISEEALLQKIKNKYLN